MVADADGDALGVEHLPGVVRVHAVDVERPQSDALGAGAQIGGDVARNAVAVEDGVFTVDIDFGAGAFDGQARYLEIRVRPAGLGVFTQLMPRQPITATPYALYSSAAAAVPWAPYAALAGCVAVSVLGVGSLVALLLAPRSRALHTRLALLGTGSRA